MVQTTMFREAFTGGIVFLIVEFIEKMLSEWKVTFGYGEKDDDSTPWK